MHFDLGPIPTVEDFDEARYLKGNLDVAAAVVAGDFSSGRHHFESYGRAEGRGYFDLDLLNDARARKMEKIAPLLRTDMGATSTQNKPDYLSNELRRVSGISATDRISSNQYDDSSLSLIDKYSNGLILDCGAGRRTVYYDNVVNMEIVNYDSTDILAVGEELPFADNSFDAVLSIAVLEHVRDPFRCAREIVRVLKPGGQLYCCVPFLQPLHGYPHHYYNMTHQGLAALFDGSLVDIKQDVPQSTWPIWTLSWFLRRWSEQLRPNDQKAFLDLRVADLIGDPVQYLGEKWASDLPTEALFELASATTIKGTKA